MARASRERMYFGYVGIKETEDREPMLQKTSTVKQGKECLLEKRTLALMHVVVAKSWQ